MSAIETRAVTARGFACIGLVQPKTAANIGAALRAAHAFGAASVAVEGARYKRHPMDTSAAYGALPLLHCDDMHDVVPFDCVPVAVELVESAVSLVEYVHPTRAFYVFGAEDATLGKRITDRCPHKSYVPTVGCMNLAATVNVILYDRQSKERQP